MKVEKRKSCTFSLFITLHLNSILITHLIKPYLFYVDVIVALQNHNDHLKEVVENASQAISIINEKHKRYLDEIEASKSNHSRELQEIKRISGVKNILPSCIPIWVKVCYICIQDNLFTVLAFSILCKYIIPSNV